MNLMILLFVFCAVPAMAIPPVKSRPKGHVIGRYHFLKIRPRPTTSTTTTTTTTTPMPETPTSQVPANYKVELFAIALDKSVPVFKPYIQAFVDRMLGSNEPKYHLTHEDLDILRDCYAYNYFFYWNKRSSSGYGYTAYHAFCRRMVDCKPTEQESTDPELARRFVAMVIAYSKLSNLGTPINPNQQARAEMEYCYFGLNEHEKKNLTELTPSDNFCRRIKRDILNPTVVKAEFPYYYPFAPYHSYWHDLANVARKDFKEITECHRVPLVPYNRRFSGPCKQYYRKMQTVGHNERDWRRIEVDMCMRQRNQTDWNEHKDKCELTIAHYKRVYCKLDD